MADPGILAEIQNFEYIKRKIAQGIEIRRLLVLRKFKLFEEFERLVPTQRLTQLRAFLERYESIYKRELSIIDLFRKGIDGGIQLLKLLKPKAGEFKGELNKTLRLYSKIDKILRRYESRMSQEDAFLHETESASTQAELLMKLHESFKKEVTGDLKFIIDLKKELMEAQRIKAVVDQKLVGLRRSIGLNAAASAFGAVTFAGGLFLSADDAVLIFGLSISVAGLLVSFLLPNTTLEERKVLAEFANFDALSKMSFK